MQITTHVWHCDPELSISMTMTCRNTTETTKNGIDILNAKCAQNNSSVSSDSHILSASFSPSSSTTFSSKLIWHFYIICPCFLFDRTSSFCHNMFTHYNVRTLPRNTCAL